MRCHRHRRRLFSGSWHDERIGRDFPPRHHNVDWPTPVGAVGEGAGSSAIRRERGDSFSPPRTALGVGPGWLHQPHLRLCPQKLPHEKRMATMLKRTDATPIPTAPETTPLPASNAFPTVLNSGWIVVDDDLQWILQSKQGSRWRNRSFCRTREDLLRCVNDYCGVVCAEALARLENLPDFHA